MTFKEFEERRGARRSGEGEAGETEVTGNELRVTGGILLLTGLTEFTG